MRARQSLAWLIGIGLVGSCAFGYDADLLGRDEVDEKALLGLRGIVEISHTTRNGRCFLNLERFAPAADWEEVSAALIRTPHGLEVSHDL